MAAAVVERARRESSPESVEQDLAALWRELARRGPVARAVMSNLIVFRFRERRADRQRSAGTAAVAAPDLLEAVIAQHPSRAIVIEHDRDAHTTGAPISADVAVSVFGPPAARYGVESIVIRSACAEVCLPSIIRHFVRGDVPTSLWWTEDFSCASPLRTLVAMGRQLVYDSRCWRNLRDGVDSLLPLLADRATDLADLNWRRLRPLRDVLAHAAGSAEPSVVAADRVHIRYRHGEGALAALLAGWLAVKLQWSDDQWPEIDEALGSGDLVTLSIADEQLVLSAAFEDHSVRLVVRGQPPLVTAVSPETDANAVAAELRTLSCETELHRSVEALARHVAHGRDDVARPLQGRDRRA